MLDGDLVYQVVSSFSVLVLESYYLKAEKECNRKYKKFSVKQ